MSFSIEITGMEDLIIQMKKLEEKGRDVASQGLYEGAGVMADRVSNAVRGIETEEFRYTKFGTRLPSPEEKALLMNARKGVSKFKKKKTSVDTSVGMQNSGYGNLKGKTKPIPLIANAINSGTSFMQPQPFFRQAVETGAGAAEAAIENKIRELIDEIDIG